jgi:hypothetical protein
MSNKNRVLALNQKLKVRIVTGAASGCTGALITITRDEFGERQFDIEYTDAAGTVQTVRLYARQFTVIV